MQEIWKDIITYRKGIKYDFTGLYQVSDEGRIKSISFHGKEREKMLKPSKDKDGYLIVSLYKKEEKKTFKVHKLVADAFIPDKSNFKSMPDEDRSKINLDDLEINHIDENKENAFASNLEWSTAKYNMNYGGRMKKVEKMVLQYDLEGNFIKEYKSTKEAERQTNIYCNNISCCCRGKYKTAGGYIWKYKD